MVSELRFTVYGNAQPAGSKRAFRHPHTGKIMVADANQKAKPWQYEIKAAAVDALGGEISGLLEGPLAVEFRFYTPRPRSHYGSGRNADVVKASAPARPITRPDVLKLSRAVEDALTGIVWKDDSQIVEELLEKHFGEPARCEIVIAELVESQLAPTELEQLAL